MCGKYFGIKSLLIWFVAMVRSYTGVFRLVLHGGGGGGAAFFSETVKATIQSNLVH